jgi:hypothetical protein
MDDDDAPSDTPGTAGEGGSELDDTKEFCDWQQQQARQRKRGWPAASPAAVDDEGKHIHRRSSGRRSSRKAFNTPKSSSSKSSSFLLEGSQSELNHLMKRNDAHSYRMRQSIILRAVLASKQGTVEIDSTFLGSDGRIYPNLRRAFNKHADMKQCSLCKQQGQVQGPWHCRVANAHVDKPDYDGGNSAEELVELFRCSVDVLEERFWSLVNGNDEGKGKQGNKKKKKRMNHNEELSMNLLNEDILYQIASFIPSLKDLVSFCKISQRCQQLMRRSIHSEKLFRGVFLQAYGMQGTRGKFESDLTWNGS